MEKGSIVSLSIAAIVGVVLIATCLLPVIAEAANTHYVNNGVLEMDEVEEFTVTKSSDSLDVVIDGVTYSEAVGALIFSNELVLNKVGSDVYFILANTATKINTQTLSGVYSDGVLTYTIGTNDAVTLSLTNLLVAKSGGSFMSTNSGTQTVYSSSVDDIRAWGWNSGLFASVGLSVGPNDGSTVTIDYVDNSTKMSDIHYSNGGNTASANNIIAPKDVYIPNEYNELLSIIPILVIVGLLLGVIGVAFRRYQE